VQVFVICKKKFKSVFLTYEGRLKSSRPNNEKNEFIISKLLLFFNIIFLKINTFIPALLQRHYPVPVVVLRKICTYMENRLKWSPQFLP